jgi:hypothetical protein
MIKSNCFDDKKPHGAAEFEGSEYMTKALKFILPVLFCAAVCAVSFGGELMNGSLWYDDNGYHVNAHGGGVLQDGGLWYWFGEHKVYGDFGNRAFVGVHCYSSENLVDWTDRGIALSVTNAVGHDIEEGCIIERPKVIRNPKTGKYVMWFHLELKTEGRKAARAGVAVADTPAGPYTFLKSLRPNGYESRDQTVFVDSDGSAYHFFSSDRNTVMRIIKLSDDYLSHTTEEATMAAGDKTEAPAVCFKDGWYYLVGSGCSGWVPNPARSYRARSIMGPWERLGNPCRRVNSSTGLGPERTWGGQSTFILKVADDDYVAMFDMWRPKNAIDGRYAWLPVVFTPDGEIRIYWRHHFNARSIKK